MAAFADLVRFIPTLGGTTDFIYSSAVGGCQSPALANVQNGVKYKFYAVSADLTQWEVFEGAWNSATSTAPRTTVLYNSSGTGTATGQSGAGTKINFSTVPQVAVIGIAEDLISVEVANSFTATQKAQARTNIAAVLKGHLFGLTLSTAGSSTTFSVAAGEAADSTAADLMVLAASISKTTSAWAVGTGNGGLDTGAIAASTWYHAHQIKRPDTGVVDVLVSLSATAPTLPTNYTLFRRIGSMKTNGSSQWAKFFQNDDSFLWSDMPALDINTTNPGTAAITAALGGQPTGVRVNALLNVILNNAGPLAAEFLFSSLDIADTAPSETASPLASGGNDPGASSMVTASQVVVWTNTSAQVRYRLVGSAVGTVIRVQSVGWNDPRGKFS